MCRFTFLLIGLCASISLFSQNNKLIKTETINKRIWNFYAQDEKSVLVNIVDNKGEIIEIRRYSDINLTTEIGEWTEYYPKMKMKAKRYFDNGYPIGIWIQYSKNGEIVSQKDYSFELEYFNNDTIVNTKLIENNQNDLTHEKYPQFNGGSDALMKFIVNEIIPFDSYVIEKYNKKGQIFIQVKFNVDIDGSIKNIRALSQNIRILEKDAVRVVRNFPKWTPGYNSNNEPCKVSYTLPIAYIF